MFNLTKEYFDQQIDKLASKEDLSELAGMIARRFDEVERKLDVREEVERLKTKMTKVWDALNLG